MQNYLRMSKKSSTFAPAFEKSAFPNDQMVNEKMQK